MPNDYTTATDLKASVPDIGTAWGSTYDTLLGALATRASREIDLFTGRKPGAYKVTTDATFYFDGSGNLCQYIPELATTPTSVKVAETGDVDTAPGSTDGDYTTWANTDYLLAPYNAPAEQRPYTELRVNILTGSKAVWYAYPKAVKITGKWGYSTTPPDEVVAATIAQAMHTYKRMLNIYNDTGAIVELGQITHTKSAPPEVEALISHLRRVAI